MAEIKILQAPTFQVIGRTKFITGQDNAQFTKFWQECQSDGLLKLLAEINRSECGPITNSMNLGISQVEKDPTNRAFTFMVGVEAIRKIPQAQLLIYNLQTYQVPAAKWAIFTCPGKMPQALVKQEMFAFMEWLPNSIYQHTNAPEMEVYFPESDANSENHSTEFWLPIIKKSM